MFPAALSPVNQIFRSKYPSSRRPSGRAPRGCSTASPLSNQLLFCFDDFVRAYESHKKSELPELLALLSAHSLFDHSVPPSDDVPLCCQR
jgi:hypothetical protein